MSGSISREAWVKLYKHLQREANKFPQYNYRVFAQRRIRDHFEKNRNVVESEKQQQLYKKGQENLELIRRQIVISQLYPHKKTVIEEKLAASKLH